MACRLIDFSYCLSSSNCLSNEHSQIRSHYAKYLVYFTSYIGLCMRVHAELLNPLDIALTPALKHILLKKALKLNIRELALSSKIEEWLE